MTAPNRIAEERKRVGMTQQELADRLGLHWITVSKLERGVIKLDTHRIAKIADALDIDLSDLIKKGESNKAQTKHDRLQQARKTAGFASASAGAIALGIRKPTYIHHENGTRDFDDETAKFYAEGFNVDAAWLILGDAGEAPDAPQKPSATLTIRLDPDLRQRMESVRSAMPYQPTITAIVERGIALALDELERMTTAVDNSGGKRGGE